MTEPAPETAILAVPPNRTYRLRIELDDLDPPIWREVAVPSDLPLDALHDVVAAAMGWGGWFVHRFVTDTGRVYGPVGDDGVVVEDGATDGNSVQLDEVLTAVGQRLSYRYDPRKRWQHTITVLAIDGQPLDQARCLAGERACPPEETEGGASGYPELLTATAAEAAEIARNGRGAVDLANVDEFADAPLACILASAGFDPEAFSVEDANDMIKQALEDSPEIDLDDDDEELDEGDEYEDGEEDDEDADIEDTDWDPAAWLSPEAVPDGVIKPVGRNDPCPCASGKKYKKCCGA